MKCHKKPSTFGGCYPKKLTNPGDSDTPGFREFHALVDSLEAKHIEIETTWSLQLDGGADMGIVMRKWSEKGPVFTGEVFMESSITSCYLEAINWINEKSK